MQPPCFLVTFTQGALAEKPKVVQSPGGEGSGAVGTSMPFSLPGVPALPHAACSRPGLCSSVSPGGGVGMP